MSKITVLINTLNEEKNIERAIKSVKGLANEIIVVDMESTDETTRIASRLGANIYNFKRAGYVEPARNFAISKANFSWILILDADEEIPTYLSKKIKSIVNSPKGDYYRFPRKNIIFGKWVKNSRWWPDYNIRLFRKGNVVWNEIIHSVPITSGIGLDLKAREKNAIIHHHYDSIEQFVDRLNRYTTEHSKNLANKDYKFDWRDLISKPSQEFFSRYFFGKGYKDGIHGLALAGLQAFSELIVYLKLWQIEKFKDEKINLLDIVEEMKAKEKDIRYWQADSLFKETGNFIYKLRRKFKI